MNFKNRGIRGALVSVPAASGAADAKQGPSKNAILKAIL